MTLSRGQRENTRNSRKVAYASNSVHSQPNQIQLFTLLEKSLGHQPVRGKAAANDAIETKKKKSRVENQKSVIRHTLSTLWGTHATAKEKSVDDENKSVVSSDEDSDQPCDAENCRIDASNNETVLWVQCDECDGWYHCECMNLVYVPEEYTCPNC